MATRRTLQFYERLLLVAVCMVAAGSVAADWYRDGYWLGGRDRASWIVRLILLFVIVPLGLLVKEIRDRRLALSEKAEETQKMDKLAP